MKTGNMTNCKVFFSVQAVFSQEYWADRKEKRCRTGEKEPLLGRFGSFQIRPSIRRKSQKKRKGKIAAATYLYQADSDGEWGEIQFDFENKTAQIIQLADWDKMISQPFAKYATLLAVLCVERHF